MCSEHRAPFSRGFSCSPVPLPDLSSCHRCGLRFTMNGGRERLQVLQSHWRIVLVCYDCLVCIRSAKVCSYCFMGFSELEKGLLGCILCSCKVHRACVPLHHRNLSSTPLDSSKFMCVDCCPIHRFRGKDFSKSGDSTSQSGFRFLLEDFLREAKSMSEKRVARDGNGRKYIVKKAVAVRAPTEITGKAPGSVQLDPAHIDLTVADKELALRLHQSMNGSQRVSRSLCPGDETRLTIARKMLECSSSVGRIVDSNSCDHHIKVQVKNKSLLADGENSQSILTSSKLVWLEGHGLGVCAFNAKTQSVFDFEVRERKVIEIDALIGQHCAAAGREFKWTLPFVKAFPKCGIEMFRKQ